MKDRGMMKWAAYKSLDRQADFLAKALYEKNKIEKPLISNERAEEIDRFLREYRGDAVKATFYSNGYVREMQGTIEVIDAFKKILFIGETGIPFRDLLRLESPDSFGFSD